VLHQTIYRSPIICSGWGQHPTQSRRSGGIDPSQPTFGWRMEVAARHATDITTAAGSIGSVGFPRDHNRYDLGDPWSRYRVLESCGCCDSRIDRVRTCEQVFCNPSRARNADRTEAGTTRRWYVASGESRSRGFCVLRGKLFICHTSNVQISHTAFQP
jgi:hypothetical protein